jgi:hypothetical protein
MRQGIDISPLFRRKPESRSFNISWTPALAPDCDPGFAGVTPLAYEISLINGSAGSQDSVAQEKCAMMFNDVDSWWTMTRRARSRPV